MRDFPSFVAAAVLGAVLALAGHWALATPAVVEPRADAAAPAPSAAVTGREVAAAPVDFSRIEGQIERLTAVVTALERRFDAVTERTPVVTQGTGPLFDGDAMVQAIDKAREKQERARLDAMPPAELKATARALLYEKKDAAGARRMLEALLERTLGNPDRGEALTELGIVHRAAQDLPASQQALQRAIDLTGIDSAVGAEAAYQLAWTAIGLQDDGRALALFDSSARSQGATEGLRLHARWNAAKLAQSAGDTARARADFTSLLRDCPDNEAFGYILKDVRARLKGM